MNASLVLVTSAWVAGFGGGKPAPAADCGCATPVVAVCEDPCAKVGLLARLKAKLCPPKCEEAPACDACAAPAPAPCAAPCAAPAPTCDACAAPVECDPCAKKPGFFARLKAKLCKPKCEAAPACETCSTCGSSPVVGAAPSGCSLPPVPGTVTPVPSPEPPKEMPKVEPKKEEPKKDPKVTIAPLPQVAPIPALTPVSGGAPALGNPASPF